MIPIIRNMGSLFIAATGQNVGKTTTCLGLVAKLKKEMGSVSFMKPVGQEHIETETGIHVDKDVLLFKNQFKLPDSYEEMSPVLFPRGFTRDYLDGKVDHNQLTHKILKSFQSISSRSCATIVEGTGHTGVGSIVDLNNAQVASLLKIPLILVASGGLGSTFDELALNYIQCEKYGVKVAGVILNRVLESKREMILEYFPKALKRWNVPFLGCIPFTPLLSSPTMGDFELLFQTKLWTGEEFRLRHFEAIRLIASSVEVYRTRIKPNQLIITPAGREDIILATLTKFWDLKISQAKQNLEVGIILTGKIPPKPTIVDQIKKAKIPMLYAPVSCFIALKMINTYTTKIRKDDQLKIKEALKVVETHIDFQMLQKALLNPSA